MELGEYLQLLDWTARQIRTDKRGGTPKELAPIFDRLQISAELWIESVLNFRKWCRSAVVVPRTTPGRNEARRTQA